MLIFKRRELVIDGSTAFALSEVNKCNGHVLYFVGETIVQLCHHAFGFGLLPWPHCQEVIRCKVLEERRNGCEGSGPFPKQPSSEWWVPGHKEIQYQFLVQNPG